MEKWASRTRRKGATTAMMASMLACRASGVAALVSSSRAVRPSVTPSVPTLANDLASSSSQLSMGAPLRMATTASAASRMLPK